MKCAGGLLSSHEGLELLDRLGGHVGEALATGDDGVDVPLRYPRELPEDIDGCLVDGGVPRA